MMIMNSTFSFQTSLENKTHMNAYILLCKITAKLAPHCPPATANV